MGSLFSCFSKIIAVVLGLSFAQVVNGQENTSPISVELLGVPEGLHVTAFWKPKSNTCPNGRVRGPALIEFTRLSDGVSFTSAVDDMSFYSPSNEDLTGGSLNGQLEQNRHKDIIRFDLQQAIAPQKQPCETGSGTCLVLGDAPVSFIDVTFDGKPDIVFRHACNGQRGRDTFSVINLPIQVGEFWEIDPPFIDPYLRDPFLSLDTGSEINVTRKEITTHASGGACISESRTYLLNSNDNFWRKFWLSKIVIFDQPIESLQTNPECYRTEFRAIRLNAETDIQFFEQISKRKLDPVTGKFVDFE